MTRDRSSSDPRLAPAELVLDARKQRIAEVVRHRTRKLVVVLDQLLDSFNMAAVARTCEGLGLQELHIIEHPQAPYRPHPMVTKGSEKWLDLMIWPDFAACRAHLKSRDFQIWASDLGEGAVPLREVRFDGNVALIFGNERRGVSPEALAGSDGRFWIPMRGMVQSFNISVAVSATLSRAIFWREEHLGVTGDLTADEAEALTARFLHLSVKQRGRIYGPDGPE